MQKRAEGWFLHSLRRAPSPSKGAGILETETSHRDALAQDTALKIRQRKTSFSLKALDNPCPLREWRQKRIHLHLSRLPEYRLASGMERRPLSFIYFSFHWVRCPFKWGTLVLAP